MFSDLRVRIGDRGTEDARIGFMLSLCRISMVVYISVGTFG